jgi:hypothetical protein
MRIEGGDGDLNKEGEFCLFERRDAITRERERKRERELGKILKSFSWN